MSAAAPREPLVLVVDDDAGSRKAMALTLATDGRRVEEFGDADSALSRAMDDPSVGLVVTDLKMPGKSGIELASDPASGPVSAKHGISRPFASRGRKCSFCASVP